MTAQIVTDKVLREVLYAFGEAYGRKVDEDTVKLWRGVVRMAGITGEQLKHGAYVVLQTPRQFFPPPGIVIEAAYTAPVTERRLPPIREGEFWASPEQRWHVESVVRLNPRAHREPLLGYIRRLATLSGLTKPEEGEQPWGCMPAAPSARLPYKEPEDRDADE